MDGDFPDYERVVPKIEVLSASIASAVLQEAVSRVSNLADTNANNRIDLAITDGLILLSSEGDYGTAEEKVEAELAGPEGSLAVAFNSQYLLDAIRHISGDLTIQFSGSTSPARIASAGDPGLCAVIVPLRAQ